MGRQEQGGDEGDARWWPPPMRSVRAKACATSSAICGGSFTVVEQQRAVARGMRACVFSTMPRCEMTAKAAVATEAPI